MGWIDYLRGHDAAAEFLEGCHEPLALPAISVAELYFGVRDGEERSRLDAFIAAFDILIVDSVIAIQEGCGGVTMSAAMEADWPMH